MSFPSAPVTSLEDRPMSLKVRGLVVVALVVLPVLPLAAVPQGEMGKKHVLLVGINRYDHAGFTLLSGAENDATALGKVLGEDCWRVTVLTGKDATLKEIRAALDKL